MQHGDQCRVTVQRSGDCLVSEHEIKIIWRTNFGIFSLPPFMYLERSERSVNDQVLSIGLDRSRGW